MNVQLNQEFIKDLLDTDYCLTYSITIPYSTNRQYKVLFRKIPWGEYKHIRFLEKTELLSIWELKKKIFLKYTKNSHLAFKVLPYGIIETVADLILYFSDSGTIPDSEGNLNINLLNSKLNLYRHLANHSIEYKMYTIICMVFRAYTFEMLEKLPFDQLCVLFATAENYALENKIISDYLRISEVSDKQEEVKPKQTPSTNIHDPSLLDQHLNKYLEEQKTRKEEQPSQTPANQSLDGYIPPKTKVIETNGMKVSVPGIRLDQRSKQTGGFDEEDFSDKLPLLTEEEAIAMQIQMGLIPAGHDLFLKEQAKLEESKKIEVTESKPKKKGSFKVRR